MLTVKLSDKPCVLCEGKKSNATVFAKSKEQEFQCVVCPEHMMSLLKKWDQVAADSAKKE